MGQHLDLAQFSKFDGRRFTSVELAGLGKVRLASFNGLAAFEFRQLLKRQQAGEDVEFELTRLMLINCIVDDAGEFVFDEQTIAAFLKRTEPDMVGKIVEAAQKHVAEGQKRVPAGAPDPNPSGASTSA
jgi:hypothetical protein